MAGNTLGQLFCVTTFGESHGEALGAIVDGVPPGMPLTESDIQPDLDRRRPGRSHHTSPRQEEDHIHILSGVFEGKTTGASIGLLIKNVDARSQDYDSLKDVFRPGHADYTWMKKYGIRDHRGGGRASARETVMRVAAGAIAKKYLKIKHKILVRGCVSQIGDIICEIKDWDFVEKNPFFCPDPDKIAELDTLLRELKKAGDSIGARITLTAEQIPFGLGEPVFDRLDADLAHAFMSIPAVKGVEIGDGFSAINQRGSQHRDLMDKNGFKTNHCGGILGGISTGQTIFAQLALKPTSSIAIPAETLTQSGQETKIMIKGRHDPCVGLRAVPIAEAMMAIVIMDHLFRYQALGLNNI